MARKRSSITLSIADHEKDQLERLALAFGQTWGEKPNVSKLLKAIARGHLRLAANHDWSPERIDTLNRALTLLRDAGHINEALCLAHLLLERSELNQPLRAMIQGFIEQPGKPWRTLIERYLRQYRPFRLMYQDAAGRLFHFTVRYARIYRHEDREYLDCWCDETEGNQDIEALRHNWCLRLDHIPDEAIISPVEGQWQPELAYVDVELHLFNRLAIAYESKSKRDQLNEWDTERQVRRVVRRVHYTFWLFREVRRYGADCVVVEPSDVRDRFAQGAIAMAAHYTDKGGI
jgi:predicted DNA-binding transcriptional regulator YafY